MDFCTVEEQTNGDVLIKFVNANAIHSSLEPREIRQFSDGFPYVLVYDYFNNGGYAGETEYLHTVANGADISRNYEFVIRDNTGGTNDFPDCVVVTQTAAPTEVGFSQAIGISIAFLVAAAIIMQFRFRG